MGNIKDLNFQVKCDKCRGVFHARDMQPVPVPVTLTLGPGMTYIDKDGDIIQGFPGLREGDQMLACPYCGFVHVWGFDPVPPGKIVKV